VNNSEFERLNKTAESMGYAFKATVGPYRSNDVHPANHWLRMTDQGLLDSLLVEEHGCRIPDLSESEIRAGVYRSLLIPTDDTKQTAGRRLSYAEESKQLFFNLYSSNRQGQSSILRAVKEFRRITPGVSIDPLQEGFPPTFYIGQCEPLSNRFEQLSGARFGIPVEVLYFGDGDNFYHAVNATGNLVIDWSIRQFAGYERKPYPFVYRLGKDKIRGDIPEVRDAFNGFAVRDPKRAGKLKLVRNA
jgi:hypothetical protein